MGYSPWGYKRVRHNCAAKQGLSSSASHTLYFQFDHEMFLKPLVSYLSNERKPSVVWGQVREIFFHLRA